jgi:hypothetical protein
MKNNKLILVGIIVAALISVTAIVSTTMITTADQENVITELGSKVTIVNNNNAAWAHWDLIIENAKLKDGSTKNLHIQVFIKPGEKVTFDLSNLLGYGNEPLPVNTTFKIRAWGGVYSTTANGTTNFDTTFLGWTTNQNPPATTYFGHVNPLHMNPVKMPIGKLPSNIIDNAVIIGANNDNLPCDQLFTEINVLVDNNGVPHFKLSSIPELCGLIVGKCTTT